MTAPEDAPLQARAAAHATTALLEQLGDKLGGRAPGTVVFGEPIVSQDVTVIPVARIGFGFSGYTGQEVATAETGEDAAAGGGAEAKPLGFIEIKEGKATYRPIRDPWVNVLVPLAGGLLAGAAGLGLLGYRVRRKRR
ncbi:spore germination protein GerW family protein [Streptomyces mirabilis]|uniref:spore germination protein GerW family protein n=1 Tax=Streptomyces mirabilis TaxID=68239 RepID=UPI0036643F86